MENCLHNLMMAEFVEFAEIKEDVLSACMTTCMSSPAGDCDSDKN